MSSEVPAKFYISLGTAKKPPAPPKSTKRPYTAIQQDSDNEEVTSVAQPLAVSHFDSSTRSTVEANHNRRAIPAQAGRSWRDASRRKKQRNGVPEDAQSNGMATNKEKTNGQTPSAITFGLNVMQKRPEEASPEDESTGDRNGATEQQVAASHSSTTTTDDQRAFAALTGEKPHSTRVVSAINEDEAFRRDYDSTPDMATLAEYEAMPIEEFGAALLRGMGWKDGDPIGKRKGQQAAKPRLLERRPALLGIGAKEEAAVGVELGAWGKGAKGGRRDQPYTPVILKNAKTGEQLTEEELKAKLEQQKMVESTEAVQKRNLSERDSDRREKRRRTAGTNGDTIVDGTTETIGVVIRTIATMTNAVPLIVATAILTGITNLVVTGDDGRKHASPAWYIAGDLC